MRSEHCESVASSSYNKKVQFITEPVCESSKYKGGESSDSNISFDLTPAEIAQLNKEICEEREDDSMFKQFVIDEMKQKQSVGRGMDYKDFQGKLDYMDK